MAARAQRWNRLGVAAVVVAVVLPATACSSTPSSTTESTTGGGWTRTVVARARTACQQGGGSAMECGCAIRYLESHGYLAAGPDGQKGILQDATNACAESLPTTTAALPVSTATSTTTSPPVATTTIGPTLFPLTLLSPSATSLDWAGFTISPATCEGIGGAQLQVSGTVVVPTLAGRGNVAGEIEAWAVYGNGQYVFGQPSQIPDAPGQYDWTVTVSNVFASQVVGCDVQGIDPDYGYQHPQ